MQYFKTEFARLIRVGTGILLIAIGIPIFILPIPFGFVLIGIGVALLLGHNVSSVLENAKRLQAKNSWLGRFVDRTRQISPVFVRRWLSQVGL